MSGRKQKISSPLSPASPDHKGDSLSDIEGCFWADKCSSQIKAELSSYGFRCILLKDHMGRHKGAWCASFITERNERLLTIEVTW